MVPAENLQLIQKKKLVRQSANLAKASATNPETWWELVNYIKGTAKLIKIG